MFSKLLRIHPSLGLSYATSRGAALSKPLVALESTIITHGLPYPANVETAKACEEAVRDAGAVPATIALLDGFANVGLAPRQLERLAACGDRDGSKTKEEVVKAGRRDLAAVLARPDVIGGTTVSGTMVLAQLAGIEIFATGGIGGVHRGAQDSMDISSDLTELGRTPVSVFSSGVKSILDVARTLEYLETQGVGVSSFNRSGEFPAFYTAKSGHHVPAVDSPRQAAEIIYAARTLGLDSGHLFGVPIPSKFEPAGQAISLAVEQAVRESEENGIAKSGKDVTPWLLKRVTELCPKALENNTALVVNNAKVAAQTAVELQKIRADRDTKIYPSAVPDKATQKATSIIESATDTAQINASSVTGPQRKLPRAGTLVIGAAALDVTAQGSKDAISSGTTYPGRVITSPGGVARNMAEAATRLLRTYEYHAVQLIAPVGEDAAAVTLRQAMEASFMRADGLRISKRVRTPSVVLNLDESGDLHGGIADTEALEESDADTSSRLAARLSSPIPLTIGLDANLQEEALSKVVDSVYGVQTKRRSPATAVLYEPTSVAKAPRLIGALHKIKEKYKNDPNVRHIDVIAMSAEDGKDPIGCWLRNWTTFMTPNESEVAAIHSEAYKLGLLPWNADKVVFRSPIVHGEVEKKAQELSALVSGAILVKMGSKGVLVARSGLDSDNYEPMILSRLCPPPTRVTPDTELNTTGAGDTFAGAMLALCHVSMQEGFHPRLWDSVHWDMAIEIAQRAAALTLDSAQAVSPLLESHLGQEVLKFGLFLRGDPEASIH
ncbi:indigoidine synthase a-like protein [Ceraceosorus bombacis]|uniref:Indigoidine synthase a-like protein n=1 Tax=Ceraceosorus bombacis TaxID=401625 RepID=A0A0P1BBS8_9BASI|nr:indigoidine synthase a-like protein [Ceraceosorus bombacis]